MTKFKLSKVDCTKGAPLGRPSALLQGSVRARLVRLTDGYDSGGAYWGENTQDNYLYILEDKQGNQSFIRTANITEVNSLISKDDKPKNTTKRRR